MIVNVQKYKNAIIIYVYFFAHLHAFHFSSLPRGCAWVRSSIGDDIDIDVLQKSLFIGLFCKRDVFIGSLLQHKGVCVHNACSDHMMSVFLRLLCERLLCAHTRDLRFVPMGWLRLVGPLKL